MSVKATAKSVRIAPRKVMEVASLVRGRTVADALTILEHTPRRSASEVAAVINSARSNAVNNHGLDAKQLTITEIQIGGGPSIKRFRPVAHGRALPYKKRSSHISVVIDGPAKATKKKSEKKIADTETKDNKGSDSAKASSDGGSK